MERKEVNKNRKEKIKICFKRINVYLRRSFCSFEFYKFFNYIIHNKCFKLITYLISF